MSKIHDDDADEDYHLLLILFFLQRYYYELIDQVAKIHQIFTVGKMQISKKKEPSKESTAQQGKRKIFRENSLRTVL